MPRAKKEDVFPNYIRVKETDQETLAELTLKAKGKRSLSEFARVCSVNPSTLSRLVNQKNSGPCADTLIKAIAENADPDSGVTLDMLLEAHGLAPVVVRTPQIPKGILAAVEETQKILKAAVPTKTVENMQSLVQTITDAMQPYQSLVDSATMQSMAQAIAGALDAVEPSTLDAVKKASKIMENVDVSQVQTTTFLAETAQPAIVPTSEIVIQMDDRLRECGAAEEGSAKMIRQAANQVRGEMFEREAGDIIVNVLIRKGYTVRMEQGSSHSHFDFSVETDALHGIGIDTWMFEVKTGIYSAGLRFLDRLFQELYFQSLYDEGKAVSLVIGDKQAFEGIREKYWKTEIYDYVSVILVDRINRCVADEFIFQQKGKDRRESVLMAERK